MNLTFLHLLDRLFWLCWNSKAAQQISWRLIQFSVGNKTSELRCAVLRWMTVDRINFCNGLAARSLPRGKLKENRNALFFEIFTEQFTVKPPKRYNYVFCSGIICEKRAGIWAENFLRDSQLCTDNRITWRKWLSNYSKQTGVSIAGIKLFKRKPKNRKCKPYSASKIMHLAVKKRLSLRFKELAEADPIQFFSLQQILLLLWWRRLRQHRSQTQ